MLIFPLYAKWVSASTTITYSITSKNTVTAHPTVTGISATLAETYGTSKQMTKGNSMTLTISGVSGKKITGLTLSMRSNSSVGAGNLSINGTYVIGSSSSSSVSFSNNSWHGGWSTSYVDVEVSIGSSGISANSDGQIIIVITSTANSIYCESFTITIE